MDHAVVSIWWFSAPLFVPPVWRVLLSKRFDISLIFTHYRQDHVKIKRSSHIFRKPKSLRWARLCLPAVRTDKQRWTLWSLFNCNIPTPPCTLLFSYDESVCWYQNVRMKMHLGRRWEGYVLEALGRRVMNEQEHPTQVIIVKPAWGPWLCPCPSPGQYTEGTFGGKSSWRLCQTGSIKYSQYINK